MTKSKYEKPTAVSLGEAPFVAGQTACVSPGDDPTFIPLCPPGNVATGNCWPSGSDAGQACFGDGGIAAPGACIGVGGSP
jgi:hypothetical protein